MRQMSYWLHDEADYLAMQWEVRVALGAMEEPDVLILLSGMERDEGGTQAMAGRLRQDFPQGKLLGCMCGESVMDGQIACDGVVVSFLCFECSHIRLLSFESSKYTSAAAGAALRQELADTPDARAVMLLQVDISLNLTGFLEEVSQSERDIVFFGGISDDGQIGAQGRAFVNDMSLTSGLAAVIFSGKDLHVQAFTSFGWRPLGRRHAITELESPYVIKKLGGRPAAEIYEHYLDIHSGDSFLWDALTFPICVERDGKLLARHPRSIREDGALVFGADFREGEEVRLAYGDPLGIIRHARVLRQGLRDFRPQAVCLVSCVARWLLLQHDVKYELDACRGLSPSYGFYAYGEYIREGGEVQFSNMTLVLAAFREGEPSADELPEPMPEPVQLTSQTDIMQHLVHFINETAGEFEDKK